MHFTQRGDTYTIKEARPEGVFFDGLAADISRLALANYCAALCVELAPQQEGASEHLRLMLNALHFLSIGTRPQHLVKSIVELRLISLAGYLPEDPSLQRICAAPLEQAFRFIMDEEALLDLSRTSQIYVQHQTGRKFSELTYWENL